MDKLAELLRQGADRLVELPNDARRFMTNPQAFTQLVTGKNPMPRETGFAAGAMSLPPTEMSVLDPNQAPYMQGYDQGEPFGIAAMALPFAAPAAVATAKALAPKAGRMAENYMVKQGFMPSVVPPSQTSQMSEFVPNVKAGDEMIVQHNLNTEKLYGANRIGGMPAPSLAISKASNPMQGFGDITLIGGKEMAIPSRKNPVFAADAYTITKPNIYTRLDKAGEDYITNKFLTEPYGKFASQMQSEMPQLNQNFLKNMEYSTPSKARFLYENNLLPDPNSFEKASDFRFAIRDKFDQLDPKLRDQYYQFSDNLADDILQNGGNIDYRIFKGYTNMGRPRYAPANLENITKEMVGKPQGAEGNIPTSGALRGAITPKLKTEKDVLKSRNKIVSAEDFEVVKENLNNQYSGLLDDMYAYTSQKNSAVDVPAFLQDVAMGKANKYEYSQNLFKEMPQDLKDRVAKYAAELKQMPTEYFEVKPQRAVSIGEFKGALVPSDLPAKARTILEKAGIKEIYQYADEAERKSLIKKFGKEMFVGIPAVPLALSNDEVQAKTRQQMLEEQFKKIE
jgi:hypothetical protein